MDKSPKTRGRFLVFGVIGVLVTAAAIWGFSPGRQQKRLTTRLIEAVRVGDLKAAETLLDAGADVKARDSDGITPLMYAARGDRPDIADPTPTDHPEVTELLIKRGAEVNAKTDTGFVALFWAARYGHVRAAKVLIAHGADVNVKDKGELTALKWAATNKHTNVVELLKVSGAKE